jgi:hypothetical protein
MFTATGVSRAGLEAEGRRVVERRGLFGEVFALMDECEAARGAHGATRPAPRRTAFCTPR